jgi:hypothetical protein
MFSEEVFEVDASQYLDWHLGDDDELAQTHKIYLLVLYRRFSTF